MVDRLVQLVLDDAQAAVAHVIAPKDVYALEMANAVGVERADPSRVPAMSTVQLSQPAIDRERSVAAACRRHDRSGAASAIATLDGDARKRAANMCHDEGIDLP